MNFAFSAPITAEPCDRGTVDSWQHRDPAFGIKVTIRFDQPMDCWEFPLDTVALSEEGFERTNQGTVLMAHQKLTLAPGQSVTRQWDVEVEAR